MESWYQRYFICTDVPVMYTSLKKFIHFLDYKNCLKKWESFLANNMIYLFILSLPIPSTQPSYSADVLILNSFLPLLSWKGSSQKSDCLIEWRGRRAHAAAWRAGFQATVLMEVCCEIHSRLFSLSNSSFSSLDFWHEQPNICIFRVLFWGWTFGV